MKAICPNNENHDRFTTTAHVMQEWVVDDSGEFIDVLEDCLQVTHKPDVGNLWTCQECGAEAIIK